MEIPSKLVLHHKKRSRNPQGTCLCSCGGKQAYDRNSVKVSFRWNHVPSANTDNIRFIKPELVNITKFDQSLWTVANMIRLMWSLWELLVLMLANLLSQTTAMKIPGFCSGTTMLQEHSSYCLSWRVAVESNNVRYFHTVPSQCITYIESYMLKGQYESDVDVVVEQIFAYLSEIVVSIDGMDAWVLDVDDTCISNLMYYENKHFGGDPYDPLAFRSWAERGMCRAIPAVLRLYRSLIESGFKIFLVTGRDEKTLRSTTAENLSVQGFVGYEWLIMRSAYYKGMDATMFKSTIRKELETEGYRIRGNIGDQWSDLVGDCVGDHTFKVPNPMYFVP